MKKPFLLWSVLTLWATSFTATVDAFCPVNPHSSALRQNTKNSQVPTAAKPVTHLSQPTIACRRSAKTSLSSSMASIMIRGGAAAASTSLPGVPCMVLASFIPTCLGYWRQGYTVSYGYGGAVASIATVMLLSTSSSSSTTFATAHASALLFYGVRLCGFLLTRELTTPVEVHQMKRRNQSLTERLQKSPLIVACSVLYFLLAAAPLRITAASSSSCTVTSMALLISTFLGFGVAALGDWYKSVVKARQPDPQNFLVTTGPFRFLRHPNYTGEMLGWTSSFALAAMEAYRSATTPWLWLTLAAVGWMGIIGVLAGEATRGLERKQEEKYGGTPEYKAWIQKSWSGPML